MHVRPTYVSTEEVGGVPAALMMVVAVTDVNNVGEERLNFW